MRGQEDSTDRRKYFAKPSWQNKDEFRSVNEDCDVREETERGTISDQKVGDI